MKNIIPRILYLLLLYTNCYSHPHTFIEVKPTIEIKNEKIEKINIRWIIDEMTSMMLIMELDDNANGKFERNESDYIYENYFLSLDKYNFYMSLTSKNQKINFIPKNFKASIENNRIIYSFDIKKKLNLENLEIKFFDELLFVGMIIENDSIIFRGLNSKETKKLKKQIFGVT